MKVKYGELLPSTEQAPASKSIGYYVAENANLTIYHSSQKNSGLYLLLSLCIGGLLGALFFVWNNPARSLNAALVLPLAQHDEGGNTMQDGRQSASFDKPSTANDPQLPSTAPAKEPTREIQVVNNKPAGKPVLMSIESQKNTPGAHSQEYLIARVISLSEGQSFAVAENMLLGEYRRGNVNQDLLIALGALYVKYRKWKKAALSYSRACENYTPNALCLYNLGVSYDHLKKYRSALMSYEEALLHLSPSVHEHEIVRVRQRIAELKGW